MKKAALIIALAGFLGCAAQQSLVQEAAPVQEVTLDNATTQPAPPPVARQMRISERFGRSMANIFFSPLELPAQMYARAVYQEDKTNNPFAVLGGLAEGIPMGALVYFPWRLYAGVVDLFSLGSPDFDRALIYPEYVTFSAKFLEETNLPLDKKPQAAKK